jgi:hypothetical protein
MRAGGRQGHCRAGDQLHRGGKGFCQAGTATRQRASEARPQPTLAGTARSQDGTQQPTAAATHTVRMLCRRSASLMAITRGSPTIVRIMVLRQRGEREREETKMITHDRVRGLWCCAAQTAAGRGRLWGEMVGGG